MPKPVFLDLPSEVQDKILLAGAELLGEKGLRVATLEDVARRAQLSLEALSHYFDGIPDLIASVLGRGIQYFNQTYIEVGEEKMPFWQRVERLFNLAAERGARFGPYLNVYFNIGGSGIPELITATFDRFEKRAALFFQNLVLSGLREGALREDSDAARIAYHLQDVTRLLMSRRAHPLYRARSEAYFFEVPFDDRGDRILRQRMLAYLQVLYAAA